MNKECPGEVKRNQTSPGKQRLIHFLGQTSL